MKKTTLPTDTWTMLDKLTKLHRLQHRLQKEIKETASQMAAQFLKGCLHPNLNNLYIEFIEGNWNLVLYNGEYILQTPTNTYNAKKHHIYDGPNNQILIILPNYDLAIIANKNKGRKH